MIKKKEEILQIMKNEEVVFILEYNKLEWIIFIKNVDLLNVLNCTWK